MNIQEIMLLLQREIEMQNQHLYEGKMKQLGGFDGGYAEGKRDAFVQIWQTIKGIQSATDRTAELEELLIEVSDPWT